MVSIERRLKRGTYAHTTGEWMDVVANHNRVRSGEWFKPYEVARDLKLTVPRTWDILEKMVDAGRVGKRSYSQHSKPVVEYRLRGKNWLTVPWGKAQPARVGPMEWARHEH